MFFSSKGELLLGNEVNTTSSFEEIKNTKPNNNIIINPIKKQIHESFVSKYKKFFSHYNKIIIDNIIFNDKTHLVAKFKDNLIKDDNGEFLRRYYNKTEIIERLKRYLEFYDLYSRIFPNYTALSEGKYFYQNIRKKQRMIDIQEQMEYENKVNSSINNKNKKNEIFSDEVIDSLMNLTNKEGIELLFNVNRDNNDQDDNNFFNEIEKIIKNIDFLEMKNKKILIPQRQKLNNNIINIKKKNNNILKSLGVIKNDIEYSKNNSKKNIIKKSLSNLYNNKFIIYKKINLKYKKINNNNKNTISKLGSITDRVLIDRIKQNFNNTCCSNCNKDNTNNNLSKYIKKLSLSKNKISYSNTNKSKPKNIIVNIKKEILNNNSHYIKSPPLTFRNKSLNMLLPDNNNILFSQRINNNKLLNNNNFENKNSFLKKNNSKNGLLYLIKTNNRTIKKYIDSRNKLIDNNLKKYLKKIIISKKETNNSNIILDGAENSKNSRRSKSKKSIITYTHNHNNSLYNNSILKGKKISLKNINNQSKGKKINQNKELYSSRNNTKKNLTNFNFSSKSKKCLKNENSIGVSDKATRGVNVPELKKIKCIKIKNFEKIYDICGMDYKKNMGCNYGSNDYKANTDRIIRCVNRTND